jgi:hypothetical protein
MSSVPVVSRSTESLGIPVALAMMAKWMYFQTRLLYVSRGRGLWKVVINLNIEFGWTMGTGELCSQVSTWVRSSPKPRLALGIVGTCVNGEELKDLGGPYWLVNNQGAFINAPSMMNEHESSSVNYCII